ncbi:MAG: thiamine phosphate synthase [Candidatus Omnitrophica bacterium]|nr:thiamine phosphate synthase [Candidatus Omnitrophota bacterium]
MKLKKRLLAKSRLYIIIDKNVCGLRPLLDIAGKIKGKGADIIQLRDKGPQKAVILQEAAALRKLFLKAKTLLIINDYLDIAKAVDADGVHLGQTDLSVKTARAILGKDKIIGISCHNLKQAVAAQKAGADYISIGPVFRTPTKPELRSIGLDKIKAIKNKIRAPFFAIGGINKENMSRVLSAGAKRIAVCGAVCKSKNIPAAIKDLREALN